ncbi:sce7726 family protein [Dietzia sp. SLG310A2-38A2]|nr:sce7726 family protein [Dietzia sp. SLG310A2-38A2]
MRDHDVRVALRERLKTEHANDPSCLVVEELGLCDIARIDVAVVNGSLTGFEIKSERDNLDRLPRQLQTYNRIFDYMNLVVAENHLSKAADLVPPWWGLVTASNSNTVESDTALRKTREPSLNPAVDAAAIVQLLWRDEALSILERLGADYGVRTKTRSAVWDRLINTVEIDALRFEVRSALKARREWRGKRAQHRSGETSPLSNTTPRFLARRLR